MSESARISAADLLQDARTRERAGSIPEAIEAYESTITAAENSGEHAILAEALRRLAVVRHHRDDSAQARDLCRRSGEVALEAGNTLQAAEALNTMGGLDLTTGSLEDARNNLLRALELGGPNRELSARVEQNLGILANIRGELEQAIERYGRSLAAYAACGDERGCAIAYHNLGKASADLSLWDEAERYYAQSLGIAERLSDVYLQGLCLVNRAEMDAGRQQFEDAMRNAEKALVIFDQLGMNPEKAGAYRVLGMVYRDTGRTTLAESRLRTALELAVAAGSPLNEAYSSRELALLYQAMGRNQEALTLLNAAHRLFRRLDARVALIYVDGKMSQLEGTYRALVREWGQSIESNDTYTFGHCERVAQNAVAVAAALGLDDQEQTTILIGAYLHDVGKVKVPHEILNKPGPLTPQEMAVVQNHPIWGVELLAGVDFPWDLKPIIRWHHERHDGQGYPDRLRGDEIPLAAQIVGIVDVYDALTSTRPYHPALAPTEAIAEIAKMRSAWSTPVFEALLRVFPQLSRAAGPAHEVADRATSEQAA